MGNVVAIIEARTASSRLPGKVLLELGDGLVIDSVVKRLKKSSKIDLICVATTTNKEDQVLADMFSGSEVRVFRGSDWNVLDRVLKAAQDCNAEIIVEITADCPFVDPQLVDYMVELLLNNNFEYVANNFAPSFADGFDVQVYYYDALSRMAQMDLSELEREHVTMKIRQSQELFRTLNLIAPKHLKRPNYSITLDTHEDYEVIQQVYKSMESKYGSNYGVYQITEFLDCHPEIVAINSSVHRKGYT